MIPSNFTGKTVFPNCVALTGLSQKWMVFHGVERNTGPLNGSPNRLRTVFSHMPRGFGQFAGNSNNP